MDNFSRLEHVTLGEKLQGSNVFNSRNHLSSNSNQSEQNHFKTSEVVQRRLHIVKTALATKMCGITKNTKLMVAIPLSKINIKALPNIHLPSKEVSNKASKLEVQKNNKPKIASMLDLLNDDLFLSSSDEEEEKSDKRVKAHQHNHKLEKNTDLSKHKSKVINANQTKTPKTDRPKLQVSTNALIKDNEFSKSDKQDYCEVPKLEKHNFRQRSPCQNLREELQQTSRQYCENTDPVPTLKHELRHPKSELQSGNDFYNKEREELTSKGKQRISHIRLNECNRMDATKQTNKLDSDSNKSSQATCNSRDAPSEDNKCEQCRTSNRICFCPKQSITLPRISEGNKMSAPQKTVTTEKYPSIEARANRCDSKTKHAPTKTNLEPFGKVSQPLWSTSNNKQNLPGKNTSCLTKQPGHMTEPKSTLSCPSCWFYVHNCDCLLKTMLENLKNGTSLNLIASRYKENQIPTLRGRLEDMCKIRKDQSPAVDSKDSKKFQRANGHHSEHYYPSIPKDTKLRPQKTKPNSPIIGRTKSHLVASQTNAARVSTTIKQNEPSELGSNSSSVKNSPTTPSPHIQEQSLSKLGNATSSEDSRTDSSSAHSCDEEENSQKRKATLLESDVKRSKLDKKSETSYQKFQRVMKTMGIKRPKIVKI